MENSILFFFFEGLPYNNKRSNTTIQSKIETHDKGAPASRSLWSLHSSYNGSIHHQHHHTSQTWTAYSIQSKIETLHEHQSRNAIHDLKYSIKIQKLVKWTTDEAQEIKYYSIKHLIRTCWFRNKNLWT